MTSLQSYEPNRVSIWPHIVCLALAVWWWANERSLLDPCVSCLPSKTRHKRRIVLGKCEHPHLAEKLDDLESRSSTVCVCVWNLSNISWSYGVSSIESSRIDRIAAGRSTQQVQEEGISYCLPVHQGESSLELRTVFTRDELDAAWLSGRTTHTEATFHV